MSEVEVPVAHSVVTIQSDKLVVTLTCPIAIEIELQSRFVLKYNHKT